METKHTQGEWRLAPETKIEKGLSIETDEYYIASVCTKIDNESDEESLANAKLIAAAPDLLAFAIEMAKRYANSPWIVAEANAVIKKATK